MLVVGPGVTTGRTVGGFDDLYAGQLINPSTGEVDDGGALLSAESVGATLLQLGDVDPAQFISDASPVSGMLVSR